MSCQQQQRQPPRCGSDIRIIQPIFEKDGFNYPFTGLKATYAATLEYKFILDTLRSHLGDSLEITEGIRNGTFEIAMLSERQLNFLRDISEDTGAYPLKHGQTNLRFEINMPIII
jgi:hypothetical protein